MSSSTIYKAGASGGGGPEFWSEVLHTTAPNDTTYSLQWQAQGDTDDVNAVISPKGYGAIQAHVADGTDAGGDVRGLGAIDFQVWRSASFQVAQGGFSFIGSGRNNKVTDSYGVIVSGLDNNVKSFMGIIGSGQDNVIGFGRAAAIVAGKDNKADGDYSCIGSGFNNKTDGNDSCVPGGRNGFASKRGQSVVGANGFTNTPGEAQISNLNAIAETTDTTTTALTIHEFGDLLTIPDHTTWSAEVYVVAREVGGANHAMYQRRLLIKKDGTASSAAIIGSIQTPNADIGSNSGAPPTDWTLTVSADTNNGALSLEVSGSSNTIRWLAQVALLEIAHA